MNPTQLEEFFKGYLEEHKLPFEIKNNIYTVKLDKTHQKWYNIKILRCTFEPKRSKKDSIELIQRGHFIFDSMVARYDEKIVISNLKIPKNTQDLMDVNERLPNLKKIGIKYNISEEQGKGSYMLFEVTINTANHKQRFTVPLLAMNNKYFIAEKFTASTFTTVHEKFTITGIKKAVEKITKILGKDFKKAEKEHNKDMKELIEIQRQHAQDQYHELQLKEQNILSKIEELEDKAMRALSFSTRNDAIHKSKSLKKKHLALVDKNKTKRKSIQILFDTQIEELQRRELGVEAKVLAFANLEFPYFLIKFEDGEEFYYFSFLEKFEKKNTKK